MHTMYSSSPLYSTLSTLVPLVILLLPLDLTKHSNLVPLSDTLTLCRVSTYTATPLVIVALVQVYFSLFARDCRVPSLSFTAILGWTGICTTVHLICTSSPIRAGCGSSDVVTVLDPSVAADYVFRIQNIGSTQYQYSLMSIQTMWWNTSIIYKYTIT